jgi:hypothetical protein
MTMPFPGMDPYLEHPVLWPSVHVRLIVGLANQLGPRLRPRYIASVEDRVYLEGPGRQRIVEELEIREHYVQILDCLRDMQGVAVIEVTNPSNKTAGPGRDSYLEKQRETLASECHLLEIDLLRRGHHVLSVPEARVRAATSYHYLACVNRWPRGRRFEVYPWRLRDPLPKVWVPLRAPDPDVPVDLPAALEQVYADGSYDLRVLYDRPCQPPLEPDDQRWASERWAEYRAAHPDLFPPGGQGNGPGAS